MTGIRLVGGRHRASAVACAGPSIAQRVVSSTRAGGRWHHWHSLRAAVRGAAVRVLWMWDGAVRVRHAFLEIDTLAGFVAIEPVGACGRFRVEELRNDSHCRQCRACRRALEELR